MPTLEPPETRDRQWARRARDRARKYSKRSAAHLDRTREDVATAGNDIGGLVSDATAAPRQWLGRQAARLSSGLAVAAHRAGLVTGVAMRVSRQAPLALVPVLLVAVAVLGLPQVGSVYEVGRPEALALEPLAARSTVVAADGAPLEILHAGENRVPVALDQVPEHLIWAVIETEDSAFFRHSGVDARGVARALLDNVAAGGVVTGGSTLTQQLAKLEAAGAGSDEGSDASGDRTLDDKVSETGLALRIERTLDKRQILERYLNGVFLGHGTYGMGAAAEYYFGKPVGALDVAEAALLVGLIAGPRRFDPFTHPDEARRRRDFVLRTMAAEGRIDPVDLPSLLDTPLPTQAQPPSVPLAHGEQYFLAEVKRRLLADERLGATAEERFQAVFGGGLRVETTLDRHTQAAAMEAVASELPESPFTAALVAVDPATGEVRALVGGPGFEDAKFNLATQGARQPGSAFKAVTLATALEAGFSPFDIVDGTSPCEFPQPHTDEPWRVENYGGTSGSVGQLDEAIIRSYNCAFARVALAVGPERVADMARRLGVERHLDPFPAITLGAEEVTPLEMATVFATLAADGVRRGPVLVRRVLAPDGTVIVDNTGRADQAVAPEVARLTTAVLRGVIQRGTGQRADIGRPAAGKTGTSQEWRNAWFGGYTPQLAAAVWMGSPTGNVSMRNVGGIRVTGGSYPAEIWAAFMEAALAGVAPADFSLPDLGGLPDPKMITPEGRVDPPPPPPPPAPPEDPEGDEGGHGRGRGNGNEGNKPDDD